MGNPKIGRPGRSIPPVRKPGEPSPAKRAHLTNNRAPDGTFAKAGSTEARAGIMVRTPRGPDHPRTGLGALKAKVKVRGLTAIDQRTLAARALLDWRRQVLDDLGGEENIAATKLALVETAVRTKLYLDHVDAFLLERSALVNRRKKLIPLVEQRQRLADSLARILTQLGLEKKGPKPVTLDSYLRQEYGPDSRDSGGNAETGEK